MLSPEEEWSRLTAEQIRTYVRGSLLKRGLYAIKELPDEWINAREECLLLSGFYQAHNIAVYHHDKKRFKYKSELEVGMTSFTKLLDEKERCFAALLTPPHHYLTTPEKVEMLKMTTNDYYLTRKSISNKFSIFRKNLIVKEND